MVTLLCGMQGGCGESYYEVVEYYDPNWLVDGRVMAVKEVTKYKTEGMVPGYSRTIELSHAAYIVAMKDDGSDEKVIYGGEGKGIAIPVASPLGNYIGYRNGRYLNIITADGTREVKTIDCGEKINSFDWSPDERKIVYSIYDRKEYYPNYSYGIDINKSYIIDMDVTSVETFSDRSTSVTWANGKNIFFEYIGTQEADGYVHTYLAMKNVDSKSFINFEKDSVYSVQVSRVDPNIIYGISSGQYKKIDISKYPYLTDTLISKFDLYYPRVSFNDLKITAGEYYQGGFNKGIWVMDIDGKNLRKLRD
jgi:hypothetical protein